MSQTSLRYLILSVILFVTSNFSSSFCSSEKFSTTTQCIVYNNNPILITYNLQLSVSEEMAFVVPLFYIRLEVVQMSLKLFVRKRYIGLNSNRTLLKYKARKALFLEVRHPRCVSNKSKCNVYTICRQTQLSTRWYANLLNVNLNNYMFRPCQPRGLVVRASDY